MGLPDSPARLTADTTPTVTVFMSPNGLPMANTWSPVRSAASGSGDIC
jgi:hypothetical protein